MNLKFFVNFQILGVSSGCQGWVFMPKNMEKCKITAPWYTYRWPMKIETGIFILKILNGLVTHGYFKTAFCDLGKRRKDIGLGNQTKSNQVLMTMANFSIYFMFFCKIVTNLLYSTGSLNCIQSVFHCVLCPIYEKQSCQPKSSRFRYCLTSIIV